MQDTEKVLQEKLRPYFNGQARRLELLSKLLLALIKLGTVNYSKLSLAINPVVQLASNVRRIQRFMQQVCFIPKNHIQFVWSLFVPANNWVALSIDRTNWKFGQKNINILMIGISYKGTAIPLIWKLLDKRGNSDQEERIELLEALLSSLNIQQQQQIKCLVADREFIGKEWLSYLKKQSFDFYIRIRSNCLMRKFGQSKTTRVAAVFNQKNFKTLRQKRVLFGHQLYVGGQTKKDKDPFILISNRPISKGKTYYHLRWGIEVFFGACKTRGFNLEDTHVTNLHCLNNLIFLVALAFCWVLKTAEQVIENGYYRLTKTFANRKVKLFSLFRIGFDFLRRRLLHQQSLYYQIKLLSCT